MSTAKVEEKPTMKEYLEAAEDRIRDMAKSAGEEIGGFTMTAIHNELKTMFLVGLEKGRTE